MISRIVLIFSVVSAAVFTSVSAPAADKDGPIVVYSGRSESLVDPIIAQFEKDTGIEVNVRYGGTAQLAVALSEEGSRSPADVFWAQDAGALGAVHHAGLFLRLPESLLSNVPKTFRNSSGTWVATSGRARVLAYSPERVQESELPKNVFELTGPKWRGRVGWAPTNGSFQAFITAMRAVEGEEKTRQWLEDMKANDTKAYSKNTPIIQAIAAGEIDLGLPNHYYLLRFKKADSNYPVAQTFFEPGHVGNLLFVSGVGILKSSKNVYGASRFIEYLRNAKAQQYFTSEVLEYPVTNDVIANSQLAPLDELLERVPDVDLDVLDDLQGSIRLLGEVGLL